MSDIARLHQEFREIQTQIGRSVIGHETLIEQLLVALFSGGHALIESSPGAARSLTTQLLAAAVGLKFSRVRCTKDLSAEDLVGQGNEETCGHKGAPGSVFANVLLVDDLPRLTPRTNTIIQQVMQDEAILLGGREYALSIPRLVVATNYTPDESAEVAREPRDDRFMLKSSVGFPTYEDELQIAKRRTDPPAEPIKPVITAERVLQVQQLVRDIEVPEQAMHYALRLVRSTRIHESETSDFVYEWVANGAGPRATHHLILAAKVRAALHGRSAVDADDIQEMVFPILRHRIETNQNARANGITVDRVISRLVYETSRDEEQES